MFVVCSHVSASPLHQGTAKMSANLGTHRAKLTTQLVDDLPLPATNMITVWDTELPGATVEPV